MQFSCALNTDPIGACEFASRLGCSTVCRRSQLSSGAASAWGDAYLREDDHIRGGVFFLLSVLVARAAQQSSLSGMPPAVQSRGIQRRAIKCAHSRSTTDRLSSIWIQVQWPDSSTRNRQCNFWVLRVVLRNCVLSRLSMNLARDGDSSCWIGEVTSTNLSFFSRLVSSIGSSFNCFSRSCNFGLAVWLSGAAAGLCLRLVDGGRSSRLRKRCERSQAQRILSKLEDQPSARSLLLVLWTIKILWLISNSIDLGS